MDSSLASGASARSTSRGSSAPSTPDVPRSTPGQSESAGTHARGSSGSFFRALTNAAREDPIPSLLIGAGCMLFISNRLGLTRFLGSRDSGNRSSMRGAASRTVTDAASNMRDQLSQTAEQLARVAQDSAATAREHSTAIGGQVSEKAARARQQAGDTARRVRTSSVSLFHDQPLLCAALGIAIGAAIAAALPSTRTEDKLLGETSDAVKDKIGQLASEQLESAKAAAGKAAQAAGTAAVREGLSASGLADAARSVGERVRRVVTEAASAGASEFRNKSGLDTQS